MDERDMEEEGKDRKERGGGWKHFFFFGIVIFIFGIENPKARRANKALQNDSPIF
jgi:hypothetical protein